MVLQALYQVYTEKFIKFGNSEGQCYGNFSAFSSKLLDPVTPDETLTLSTLTSNFHDNPQKSLFTLNFEVST